MKKLLLTILIVGISLAESSRVDLRYDFLNFGFNSRVQALGNTGIISSEGQESIFYNPALIFNAKENGILFAYNPYEYDHSQMYFFYTTPMRYRTTRFGLGIIFDVIDNVEFRTTQTDTPSIQQLQQRALVLSMARQGSKNFAIGMNTCFIYDDYSSEGNYMVYTLSMLINQNYAIAVKHFGDKGYSGSVGVNLDLIDNTNIYLVAEYLANGTYKKLKPKYGVTYKLLPELRLHAGVNGKQSTSGFTYKYIGMDISYALVVNDLGSRHSVSIGIW